MKVDVETDKEVTIDGKKPSPEPSCIQQVTESDNYAITRLSQEEVLPSEDDWHEDGLQYTYESALEQDCYCYVIDTGIDTRHEEFEGRAEVGYVHPTYIDSNVKGKQIDVEDDNGHGTHVAGIAIGKKYGVAKKCRAVSAKAFNDEGQAFVSTIVDTLEWAVAHIISTNRKGKSVINASFGTGVVSKSLNDAVEAVLDSGIPIVMAAGNSNTSACNRSPAGLGGGNSSGITVAATTRNDILAAFSDYGPCVDVLAPGVSVKAAWIKDPPCKENCYALKSGTSMSAPLVSGIVARYLGQSNGKKVKPSDIKKYITDAALEEKINLLVYTDGTPNRLAHAPCEN